MIRNIANYSRPKVLWSLRLLLILCLLSFSQFALPHKAFADTTSASDNFQRADGPLGPNWADVSDGGLAISSDAVTGKAGQITGDMWTADAFTSDQFSQVEVTSTQLTGSQWIGPAVRAQNGGQDGYVGFYYWNGGSPELMLFKRTSGAWAQIGAAYSTAALAAGTQLEVEAVGSTISFLENGVVVITATDSSITGGAPGIMAYGSAEAGNWSGGDAADYTVGGTVSGLSGTVVLQDNGGDNLSVSANGSFTFATSLASGAAYAVTVQANPAGQTCTVSGGSGTLASANVTNVAVTCTNNSTTATSASDNFQRADGPLGPNWADVSDGGLAISSDAVTGKAGQITGDMWTADAFTSDQFSQVEVTSTQLTGSQWIGPAVRAQNGGQDGYVGFYYWNGGSPELMLFKRTSGAWAQIGAAYSTAALAAGTQLEVEAVGSTISFLENGVVVITATDSSITGGAPGIMAYGSAEAGNWSGGDAADYTVGGTVSGLSGTVVLQDNGGDNLSVSANGSFTFATSLASGAAYAVTVQANPAGQTCTVSGGSGTLASANVTNVAVTCTNNSTGGSFSVGGTVSGLSGTVVLQDNGGDNLSVNGNGSFTFATPVASGAAYAVTVLTNPSGQTCTVANGSGTVASANVTNVAVSCTNNSTGGSFSVGGTVSGLSGTVVLQDNGGDNLSVSANGSFTFATSLASGAGYNVTVMTYPSGQTCTVANGSGTVASANVTNVAVSCTNSSSATSASDNFARADGSLGPNWTDISDGGLAISSDAVTGKAGQITGDMWTADAFTSDQFSQVEVTSTQLTGSQWIGPAVRAQNGGQDGYVGFYNWNGGSPELMLFKRTSGAWAQIGAAYSTAALAAGTQLEVEAVGSTISFLENGIVVITATDSSITGGAPGIMAYGSAEAGNWSGGNASTPRFQATYMSTDANGIQSYQVISSDNGYGPQVVRVLRPTDPAPGVPHNFLYVLPVEPGLGDTYGDGMETMLGLNAQNQYNLTIIEPTFGTDPWYADNPSDPNVQYETYMTQDLVPWVEKNLATTGSEQNWLIGFSKSGIGAQDLILKHPDIFTLAAAWDFPADMSSYDQFGADSAAGYGTDANFQANYRLTQAFVDSHKAPFLSNNRIWIGGYSEYQADMSDYDALLTSEGIAHTTETPTDMGHSWDSGWVSIAMAALYQDSTNLSPGS